MKLIRAMFGLEVLTIMLWFTRIRNVWSDDATSNSTRLAATLLGVGFVLFATVALGAAWRLRSTEAPARSAELLIGGFAVGSSLYWLVRVIQIAGRDHALGFVVVHTLLGIAVVGLSALVLLRLRDRQGHQSSARNVDRHRRATNL